MNLGSSTPRSHHQSRLLHFLNTELQEMRVDWQAQWLLFWSQLTAVKQLKKTSLRDSATGAKLLINRVTKTNDSQQGPKWTHKVSLKLYVGREGIIHYAKWLVYFCYNSFHEQICVTYYTNGWFMELTATDCIKHMSTHNSLQWKAHKHKSKTLLICSFNNSGPSKPQKMFKVHWTDTLRGVNCPSDFSFNSAIYHH